MDEHHVPVFFQSPWTDGDGLLARHALNRRDARILRRGPKAFGYLKDYTAFVEPIPAGIDKNAMEKSAQKLDSAAARVRDLMLAGVRPSPGQYAVWASFLLFMRIREPEMIAYAREEGTKRLMESLAANPDEYEKTRGPDDPPNMIEWVRQAQPGLIENAALFFLPEIVNDAEAHKRVFNIPFAVADFQHVERKLLLGDRPLLRVGDLRTDNVILTIPLSPTKAFMATPNAACRAEFERAPADELVLRINEETLNRAREYVFAADETNVDIITRMQVNRAR